MLLAVLGRSGSGKDTFADFLVEERGFTKMAFAEPIYEIARKYFGMQYKNRFLLQDIGQSMRRINPRVFVDLLKKRVETTPGNIIVTDVRQKNEFDMLKELGFTFVHIDTDLDNRAERISKRDNTVLGPEYLDRMEHNPAETGCDEFKRSGNIIQVNNNGTLEDLKKQALKIADNASEISDSVKRVEEFAQMLERKFPKKDKKIFLSGAISSRLDTYKMYFNAAADVLTKHGWDVYNPAYIPVDTDWHNAMRETIRALTECDVVYILAGYNDSEGVEIEFDLAKKLGLMVVFE